MNKFLNRMAVMFAALGVLVTTACSDDDDGPAPDLKKPETALRISEVQRTQASFVVEAAGGVDYAYIVTEKDTPAPETAEEIFANGTVGELEDGKATLTTLDVEGGKMFTIYLATRKINPYVYSDIVSLDVDTSIPYTDIVTLDKIGLTDFTYHVEVPEGEQVKHVVVKKADYEAIKGILAMFGDVTYENYLKVFGHTITESADITLDKQSANALDGGIHIYSGSTYLLMTGVVMEDKNIDPERFQLIEFDTRHAGKCPYDFEVSISTTSTTATVNVVPDPEIVSYRLLIDKKTEFDFANREGESQLRSLIIGYWDDDTNAPKRVQSGAVEVTSPGLVPNTQYVVGIVGFDAQNREVVKTIDFVTGEPTGPKPTVTLTSDASSVTAPWNSAAYNVKITNANDVRYGFFTKADVDRVLGNGSTIAAVLQNNGYTASSTVVAQMLSPEGCVIETSDLSPSTEYIFGVIATNAEYVSEYAYEVFTTEALPQIGGAIRANMPGKYIASTTDENGATVTFPVTITTGVDEATTAEYSAKNRLVALGFGPEESFPVKYPADMTAAGVDEANYGPKWFIEFREDAIVVPDCKDSDTRALDWTMGYNENESKPTYMWGIGIRSNGREQDNNKEFPITVSEDGNTITVNPVYQTSGSVNYYPTMVTMRNSVYYSTVLFRCYSELVLTRQENNASALHKGGLKAPKLINMTIGENNFLKQRNDIVNKIK